MISKILEIFGRAVKIDTAQVIWHWLEATNNNNPCECEQNSIREILDLIINLKLHLADEKIAELESTSQNFVLVQMAKVILQLKRNQLENAVQTLNLIYQQQPNNTMALYALGHCYERLSQDETAVKYYQDCIKFKGYLQLPRQRLGAIYFKNSRIKDAIEQYKHLVAEYPDDISSYVILGYLFIINQEYDFAVEAFNNAITHHPDNFQNNSEFIEIDEHIKNSDTDRAVESLKFMFEQYGEQPELYIKLSDIHLKEGNFQDAANCLLKASRLQPDNMQACIKLASLYLKMDRLGLAAEKFNNALELNDEIVDAYIGLATAQHLNNQQPNCIDTISMAAAIQQNSTLLYGQVACLKFRLKNNLDAHRQTSIEKLVYQHLQNCNDSPQDAEWHYKAGLILLAAGDFKQASDKFRKSLELNSYHFRAKSKLAICYIELNKASRVSDLLNIEETLDSETVQLHYKTAILYCDQNKFDEAVNKLIENFEYHGAIDKISAVLTNIGVIDRAEANLFKIA